MGGVLDITKWKPSSTKRVSDILRSMGVAVKGNANSFWRTNEDELEYIYNDFRKKERQLKARYHPDREDGDAEMYRKISQGCDLVRRQMERRGIIKISPADLLERREQAAERHKARNRLMSRSRNQQLRNGTFAPQRRGRPRNRPHTYVTVEELFTPEELKYLSKDEMLRRRKRRNKAEWRKVPGNAQRERETKKRYYEAHKLTITPEQRERRNAYMRAYIKRPERMVKNYRACLKYRLTHPERVRQWKRNYAEKTKGRPRFRKYPEGRCKRGSLAWKRRKEWRRDRWADHREELNRKRRAWYAARRGAKYKQPRIKDHKGRFLPALEAAA